MSSASPASRPSATRDSRPAGSAATRPAGSAATRPAGTTARAPGSRSSPRPASSSAWWRSSTSTCPAGRARSATSSRRRHGAGAIAGRALRLLARWALGPLGLERVELRISVDNEPSLRVAERLGFVREGVLRSAHLKGDVREDVAVYSLLRTRGRPAGRLVARPGRARGRGGPAGRPAGTAGLRPHPRPRVGEKPLSPAASIARARTRLRAGGVPIVKREEGGPCAAPPGAQGPRTCSEQEPEPLPRCGECPNPTKLAGLGPGRFAVGRPRPRLPSSRDGRGRPAARRTAPGDRGPARLGP